jgi:hypothetical protein
MAGDSANLAVWRRDFRKDGEEGTDEVEEPDWNTVSWVRMRKDRTYSRSLLKGRENEMRIDLFICLFGDVARIM